MKVEVGNKVLNSQLGITVKFRVFGTNGRENIDSPTWFTWRKVPPLFKNKSSASHFFSHSLQLAKDHRDPLQIDWMEQANRGIRGERRKRSIWSWTNEEGWEFVNLIYCIYYGNYNMWVPQRHEGSSDKNTITCLPWLPCWNEGKRMGIKELGRRCSISRRGINHNLFLMNYHSRRLINRTYFYSKSYDDKRGPASIRQLKIGSFINATVTTERKFQKDFRAGNRLTF